MYKRIVKRVLALVEEPYRSPIKMRYTIFQKIEDELEIVQITNLLYAASGYTADLGVFKDRAMRELKHYATTNNMMNTVVYKQCEAILKTFHERANDKTQKKLNTDTRYILSEEFSSAARAANAQLTRIKTYKRLRKMNLPTNKKELIKRLDTLKKGDVEEILDLFNWKQSPQGFDYWCNLALSHSKSAFWNTIVKIAAPVIGPKWVGDLQVYQKKEKDSNRMHPYRPARNTGPRGNNIEWDRINTAEAWARVVAEGGPPRR